jgi:hypothetical protein
MSNLERRTYTEAELFGGQAPGQLSHPQERTYLITESQVHQLTAIQRAQIYEARNQQINDQFARFFWGGVLAVVACGMFAILLSVAKPTPPPPPPPAPVNKINCPLIGVCNP